MTRRIIQFLKCTFIGVIGYRTYIYGIKKCYWRLLFVLATHLVAGSAIAQLKNTQEQVKQTVEFETRDFALFTDNTYTPVTTYKGNTYFVWVDKNFRPKVGKIVNGKVSVTYLDKDPKYKVLDNNHHRFSIGVDKDGYLHITGDMHHYPKSAVDHLPIKYQNGIIMYWVSDRPEDITGFSWMGKNKDRALPGYGFTYLSFQHDMDGELYARCRNRIHKRGHFPGEIGYSVYRYNTQNKKWTNLGGKAPSNPAAEYNSIIWEDDAHEKKVTNPNFYQGFLGQMRFDFNNRLHVAGTINNNTLYDAASHVIYAYSDDLGNTFHRADGSKIQSLPIRVDPGPGQGDIIDGPDKFATYASASYDMEGNPIVTYTRMNEKASHGLDNSTFKYFQKGSWSKKTQYPTGGHVKNIPVLDPNGVLNFLNNVGHVHRTFQVGQQGYDISLGGNFMSLDERALREQNVLRGMMLKDGKLQILRVEFIPETKSLPSEWDSRQLGDSKGQAGLFNNVLQLKASGRGFVNNSIDAQYSYQVLSGDGEIKFRVLNVNHTSNDAFAGVMISESPGAESAFMSSVITSHNGIKTYYRQGNSIQSGKAKGHYQPSEWLRLVRDGNNISTFHSANGRNWQLIESRQMDLPQTVYVGIVAASGTANEGHARVDQVRIERNKILGNLPPAADAGPDKTITLPKNSINLNGKATDPEGNVASLMWKKISGPEDFALENENTAELQVSGLTEGQYVFRLTAKDDKGATHSDDVQVIVQTADSKTEPGPSIGGDVNNASCAASNGGVILSLEGGKGPFTYQWSNGATSKNLNNVASGEYQVKVTDAAGKTVSKSFTVESNKAQLQVEAEIKNTSCSQNNGSIKLQASGGTAPYSYEWSTTGRSSSTTKLAAGSYTVVVKDQNGCSKKFAFEVKVDAGATKLDVTAEVANASCAGNDGAIALKVAESNGPYSFVWDHGTTGSRLESLEQGKYRVTITDVHGCFMKTEYTINQSPGPAKPVVKQSADSLFVNQEEGASYQWFKDNKAIAGGTQPALKYTEAGNYSVKVSNNKNCSASSDYYYAQDPPMGTAQGAEHFTLNQFDYYPNPTANYLNVGISVNQPAVTSVYIYDFTGKLMLSQELGVIQSQTTEQVPVAQYPAGTYLIRIRVNDEVITKRFIKM